VTHFVTVGKGVSGVRSTVYYNGKHVMLGASRQGGAGGVKRD
jgi:hypothetical protein